MARFLCLGLWRVAWKGGDSAGTMSRPWQVSHSCSSAPGDAVELKFQVG
jgi:hypothetical protein